MRFEFPYPDVEPLEIGQDYKVDLFSLPECRPATTGLEVVRQALEKPIGTEKLSDLARGKKKIVIVI